MESLQWVLWLLSAGLAGVHVFRPQVTWADRFFSLGLAEIAVIAALREWDAHILLNPEHLGPVGLRYRLDWWISNENPMIIRQLWATVFLLAAVPVALSIVVSWHKLIRILRGPDLLGALLLGSGFLLFAGFAADDLFREASFISVPVRQGAEEIAELGAAILFLAAAVAAGVRTLSTRDAGLVRCSSLNASAYRWMASRERKA